jgi:hypothetical protein
VTQDAGRADVRGGVNHQIDPRERPAAGEVVRDRDAVHGAARIGVVLPAVGHRRDHRVDHRDRATRREQRVDDV